MRNVRLKIKEKDNPAVARFLGDEARVVNKEQQAINNYIDAEWLAVVFPDNNLPEENGLLHLFPVDDDAYSLQLIYLQHGGQPYTATVCILEFRPDYFQMFPLETLSKNIPFRFDQTTEQQFSICAHTRNLLEQLQNVTGLNDFLKTLQLTETATHILRRAVESITVPFAACQVPACRFLAHDSERDKVMDACQVIQDNLDHPLTIKELSRKVAMNECYLKKGFKALTGKTIHEYTQELRIAKAKLLLQQDGQSVSDVANSLGYSSISHFSTAFKKATGMKPCELLR